MAKFTLARSSNIDKDNGSNGRFLPDYLDSKFEQKLELRDNQEWERDNCGQLQIPSSAQKYIITLTCEENIMPNIISTDIGKLFNIECSNRVFAFIERNQKVKFYYKAVPDSIIAHYDLDQGNKNVQVTDESRYLNSDGFYIKEEKTDKNTKSEQDNLLLSNKTHQNDDSQDDEEWDKASSTKSSINPNSKTKTQQSSSAVNRTVNNPVYGIIEESISEKSMWYSYRPIIRAYLKSFTSTKENHNTSKWALVFVEE